MELLAETRTLYDSKVRAEKDCSKLEALRAKIKQRRTGFGATSNTNNEHELGARAPANLASQKVLFKENEDDTDVFSDGPLSPVFEPKQCSRSQLYYGGDSLDDDKFQRESTKKHLELEKTYNEKYSTAVYTAVAERNKSPPHLLPSLVRSPIENNGRPYLKRNQLSLEEPCETFWKHNMQRCIIPHKKHKPGIDLLSSDDVPSRPLPKEKRYEQQSRLLSADTLAAQDLSLETKETAKETQRTSLCSPVSVVSGSSPEIIVDDNDVVNGDVESFRRSSLQECLRMHHPVSFGRLTQRSAEEEREATDFWSKRNSSIHALAGAEHFNNFQTLQNGTFENKNEEICSDRNTGSTEKIFNEQENVSTDAKSFSLPDAHLQISPSDGKPTVPNFDSETEATKSKNVQFCGARGRYRASKKTGAVRKYCTVRNPAPNSLIYKLVAQLNDAYSRVPTQSEHNLNTHQFNKTSIDDLQASDLDQTASTVESLDCTKHNNQDPNMKYNIQNKEETVNKNVSMTSPSLEASNQTTVAFTPSSPITSSSVLSCDHNKTKSVLYSSYQATIELKKRESINTSPGETKESHMERNSTINSETYSEEETLFNLGKEEKVLELNTKKNNSPSEEMDSLTSELKNNQVSSTSTSKCFDSVISATAPCACAPADTAEIGSTIEKNRETEYEILTVKSDSEIDEEEGKHRQVLDSKTMDKRDLPSITVHFQPESLPPLLVSNDDALTGLSFRQDLLRKKMKNYHLPKNLMKSIRKRASHSCEREQPLQNDYK